MRYTKIHSSLNHSFHHSSSFCNSLSWQSRRSRKPVALGPARSEEAHLRYARSAAWTAPTQYPAADADAAAAE